MRKILFILLALPMMMLGTQRVAVLVTSPDHMTDVKEMMANELAIGITQDKEFQAVDRTAVFEHNVQDMQSNEQICQIGSQLGVDIICVADITPLDDSYLIQSRFVDVRSHSVITSTNEGSPLASLEDIINSAGNIAERLCRAVPHEEEMQRLMAKQEARLGTIVNIEKSYRSYLLIIKNEQDYGYIIKLEGQKLGVVERRSTQAFRIAPEQYGALQAIQRDGWLLNPSIYKFKVPKLNATDEITFYIHRSE